MTNQLPTEKTRLLRTSVIARATGINVRKILRLCKRGKLATAKRESNAPQSPWLANKEEALKFLKHYAR